MFSRQTKQDALALMFMEDVIDEVEFLMLYETVNKKNPSFPYWSYNRFDLIRLTDEECKAEFRFGLAELPQKKRDCGNWHGTSVHSSSKICISM